MDQEIKNAINDTINDLIKICIDKQISITIDFGKGSDQKPVVGEVLSDVRQAKLDKHMADLTDEEVNKIADNVCRYLKRVGGPRSMMQLYNTIFKGDGISSYRIYAALKKAGADKFIWMNDTGGIMSRVVKLNS